MTGTNRNCSVSLNEIPWYIKTNSKRTHIHIQGKKLVGEMYTQTRAARVYIVSAAGIGSRGESLLALGLRTHTDRRKNDEKWCLDSEYI